MHRGFTKRWRKRWEHGYHKDRLLWIMIDYLIDHASFEDKKVYFERYGTIELKRGEIIYGRKGLAKILFASQREIRTRISALETIGFLTIKTTNRFTIATICNYDIYNPTEKQERPTERPASDQQATSKRPQSNELKEYKEYKDEFSFQKKVPLPSNIFLTDNMIKYISGQGGKNGAGEQLFEDFKNYHGAKGNKFTNWNRAFQTWVRKDKEWHPEKYVILENME